MQSIVQFMHVEHRPSFELLRQSNGHRRGIWLGREIYVHSLDAGGGSSQASRKQPRHTALGARKEPVRTTLKRRGAPGALDIPVVWPNPCDPNTVPNERLGQFSSQPHIVNRVRGGKDTHVDGTRGIVHSS